MNDLRGLNNGSRLLEVLYTKRKQLNSSNVAADSSPMADVTPTVAADRSPMSYVIKPQQLLAAVPCQILLAIVVTGRCPMADVTPTVAAESSPMLDVTRHSGCWQQSHVRCYSHSG